METGISFLVQKDKNISIKLKVNDIWLNFGGVSALSGVSFDVKEGEMLAVIGPNGAGKTSILNCINGFYRPRKGDDFRKSEHLPSSPSPSRSRGHRSNLSEH